VIVRDLSSANNDIQTGTFYSGGNFMKGYGDVYSGLPAGIDYKLFYNNANFYGSGVLTFYSLGAFFKCK